jgi:hypothetical protein
MILGWWIDEVPSTITIIRATRMMVEKYGCPDSGQFDNGRDFTSYWFTGNDWNERHNRFGKKEHETMSGVTGDLGMASHFTLPYHGQSKHIERAFGFFAQEFDKSFESYPGSNTSDRHDESRLYTGSFDGAPTRPVEELPTIEETRQLFADSRSGTTRSTAIPGRAWTARRRKRCSRRIYGGGATSPQTGRSMCGCGGKSKRCYGTASATAKCFIVMKK